MEALLRDSRPARPVIPSRLFTTAGGCFRTYRASSINGDVIQERCPSPQGNKQVSFVPLLVRGLGISIHPFLRGLLYFYGLQLHHLSPNSILHIACFVTLCESFLKCQPHFSLWCKYFCVQPRASGGTLFECARAVICRVARSGYHDGSFEDTNENWKEEWFYLPDVLLDDPLQVGHVSPSRQSQPRSGTVGARRIGHEEVPRE